MRDSDNIIHRKKSSIFQLTQSLKTKKIEYGNNLKVKIIK